MNKILHLVQAIGCLYEMELRQKGLKGLQWLEAIFEFWIGGFLFFILLAVSICIGDATIPTYLGDGYSYDNFSARRSGSFPEQSNKMNERSVTWRQTNNAVYIYNRKQAGKPLHDWSYKKSPVT